MVELTEIQAAYYMVVATGVLVEAAYYVMNVRTKQRKHELKMNQEPHVRDTSSIA
jgi:hypothetical protein